MIFDDNDPVWSLNRSRNYFFFSIFTGTTANGKHRERGKTCFLIIRVNKKKKKQKLIFSSTPVNLAFGLFFPYYLFKVYLNVVYTVVSLPVATCKHNLPVARIISLKNKYAIFYFLLLLIFFLIRCVFVSFFDMEIEFGYFKT